MRKSFELLDWMKEHFKGGGVPSVLCKFTNGLKEQGGTVSVDAGNGISVNEHTKMLEVPIGEHLSYTSQGIDAKEGDTAQKGVVQLTDAIEAHADHTTAATPAAVKEYVDANVVIGGGGDGKTYTFKDPLAEHLGAVSVADASTSAKGVVKLTHTVSHGEHPNEAVTPDGVAAYVDAKVADAGGFSFVKAMQATPDFKLIDGSMVQSGKLVYGVLTFACTIQKSITDIASLPLMPKSPFTVKVIRMSNNPVEYEATVNDNGTVALSSAQNVQTGTYTVTIAMQTK